MIWRQSPFKFHVVRLSGKRSESQGVAVSPYSVLSCINVAKLAKANVAVTFFCMESMSLWLDTRFFSCKITDSIGGLCKRTQFVEKKIQKGRCHCLFQWFVVSLANFSVTFYLLLLLILLLINLYNAPIFILALSTHGTNARSKLARWHGTKQSTRM